MVVAQLAFTYAPPFNVLFITEPIGLAMWLPIIGIGLLTSLVIEAEKQLRNVLGRPIALAPAAAAEQP